METDVTGRAALSTRERILRAASELLTRGGRDAVSTRAVSALAGVQAPVIYRHFGDKQGLLDAVAAVGFSTYLASYGDGPIVDDPLEDLRRGWDANVGFGLANPYLFALVYGDPSRYATSPTAAAARAVVEDKIRRLAQSGRLRVREALAADLLISACSGATLTLIAQPEEQRDDDLARAAREAVIAVICTGSEHLGQESAWDDAFVRASRTLRAGLKTLDMFTPGERALFDELLERVSSTRA